MKLRNKKTGEIVDLYEGIIRDDGEHITIKPVAVLEKCYIYNSLAELNAEWEDAPEEPKYFYCISIDGSINKYEVERYAHESWCKNGAKIIGNYFETREEAERAVEKLKAVKRLKDKGFRFIKDWVYRYDMPKVENHTYFEFVAICEDGALFDDLDLLFGGEE